MKKVLVFLLVLFGFLETATGDDNWLWLNSESPISGRRIAEGTLPKEYLLFIYMNDTEEMLRLIPVLQNLQGKYKGFNVVLSYMDDNPQKLIAVMREYNVKIPLYSKLSHPKLPEPNIDRNSVITSPTFDVCGETQKAWDALSSFERILIEGDPTKVETPEDTELEGTLDKKPYGICNPLAQAVVKDHEDMVKAFEPERAWKAGYKRLSAMVKRYPDDQEALAMQQDVERYLSSKGDLNSKMRDEPAAALFGLTQLARAAKGIQPYEKEIQRMKAELEQDREVKLLAGIIGRIYKFEKSYDESFGSGVVENAFERRPEPEGEAKEDSNDDAGSKKASAKKGFFSFSKKSSKDSTKKETSVTDEKDSQGKADKAETAKAASGKKGSAQDADDEATTEKAKSKAEKSSKDDDSTEDGAKAGKQTDSKTAKDKATPAAEKGKKASAESLKADAEKILFDLERFLQTPQLSEVLAKEATVAVRRMNTYVKLLGGEPLELQKRNQMTKEEKDKFDQAKSAFSGLNDQPEKRHRRIKKEKDKDKTKEKTRSTRTSHSRRRSSRER